MTSKIIALMDADVIADDVVADCLAEMMAEKYEPASSNYIDEARQAISVFLQEATSSCFWGRSLKDDAVQQLIIHGAVSAAGWKKKAS